jgi:hypothetical protein
MYTGLTYPINVGIDGWSAARSQTQIKSTQLIQAFNVTYQDGVLGKEGGTLTYTAAPISGAPQIDAGVDYWPTPSMQRSVIFLDTGVVLKDNGLGTYPVTLISGLNAPNRAPQFVTGGSETQAANKKLFLFTDTNQVKVLSGDGATMANIALPPADWTTTRPVTGCIHNNRLWGGAGHFVYYSNLANHEDFTTVNLTGLVSIYPGVGEEIVHIESFKGMLLIFKKPAGIYFVDTSNVDVTQWTVSTVSDVMGAAGPGCVVSTDNDMLFMDPAGNVNMVSAVTQELPQGTFAASSLTFAANINPWIQENINFSQLDQVQSMYYPAKREVHFTVPLLGTSVPNSRLVIDYNRPDIARFRNSARGQDASMWGRKDANSVIRPMIGDTTGNVWFLDQDARSVGGAGYTSTFQTGHEDFGSMPVGYPSAKKLGGMDKNFHFLEAVFDPKGNWTLSVDCLVDGQYMNTCNFNMGSAGAALDSFVLDTDVLGGGAIAHKRLKLYGKGRRISFVGSTSGAGEDFSIDTFFVQFKPASE